MRRIVFFLLCAACLTACDDTRVFEKNHDFNERHWVAGEKPEFEFEIPDNKRPYNVYCNIRNSLSYPYSRLFINYYLQDSTGKQISSSMVNHLLFDPKTGKPQGTSGLGDIYDHRSPLLSRYNFPYAGKYKIKFEQFMRLDTLDGILAVGARIEHAAEPLAEQKK